jgi:hypothetical protein
MTNSVGLRLLGKITVVGDFIKERAPSHDSTCRVNETVADLISLSQERLTPQNEARLLKIEKTVDEAIEVMANIEENEWDSDPKHGLCPHCHAQMGFIYVGGTNAWYFCTRHKVKWNVGPDLFADEFPEGEDDGDRGTAHVMGFGEFKEITLAEAGMDEKMIQRMEERRQRMIKHKSS